MKFDPLKDGISSVQLIDHMGSDLTVVNAARVSMAKASGLIYDEECPTCEGNGTYVRYDNDYGKSYHECDCGIISKKDCGLISYLARHNHWTPFGHPQIQLRIKMPLFVARQWYKHMAGFNRNEVSRRYVDDPPEFYVPKEWRQRAASVKQGSSEELVTQLIHPEGAEDLWGALDNKFHPSLHVHYAVQCAVDMYSTLLDSGVCPEQARMVLPQSMYTEFVEVGSLAAYARLAGLRLGPHAQKEVRWYAEAIDKIMGELFPVSWAALTADFARP